MAIRRSTDRPIFDDSEERIARRCNPNLSDDRSKVKRYFFHFDHELPEIWLFGDRIESALCALFTASWGLNRDSHGLSNRLLYLVL